MSIIFSVEGDTYERKKVNTAFFGSVFLEHCFYVIPSVSQNYNQTVFFLSRNLLANASQYISRLVFVLVQLVIAKYTS